MSLFRKNIAATYSTQVIGLASNFISSVLAARMLGKAGQGDLTLYTIFIAFLILVMGLGLPSAIVYYLAAKKIAKGKIIPLFAILTFLLISVLFVLFYAAKNSSVAGIFLPAFVLNNNIWVLVLFVHLLLMMVNQFFLAVLQGENKFKAAGLINVAGCLLQLTCYAAWYYGFIAFVFGSSPSGITPIGWVLGSLLLVAAFQYLLYVGIIWRVDRAYFRFVRFNASEVKPLFVFAGLAYLANMVQFLNYKMDAWFLQYFFHDKSMVGVYGLSATLSQLVWHLPIAVHSVLYTYIAAGQNEQEKFLKANRASNYLLLYACAAGLAGYFLAQWLVPTWYGSEFSEVPGLVGILLLGIVPFCYGMGLSAYFAGTQKVEINLQGSVAGLGLCLIFDLLLIPAYGMYGAAYASVISYTGTVIYYAFRFHRLRN